MAQTQSSHDRSQHTPEHEPHTEDLTVVLFLTIPLLLIGALVMGISPKLGLIYLIGTFSLIALWFALPERKNR